MRATVPSGADRPDHRALLAAEPVNRHELGAVRFGAEQRGSGGEQRPPDGQVTGYDAALVRRGTAEGARLRQLRRPARHHRRRTVAVR